MARSEVGGAGCSGRRVRRRCVDLGDLKGNIGDQNYVIPDGVDLEHFTTVVIW